MKLQYVIFKRSYLYNVKGLLSWQLSLVKSFKEKGLTLVTIFKEQPSDLRSKLISFLLILKDHKIKKIKTSALLYILSYFKLYKKRRYICKQINTFCNSFKG